MNERGLYSSLQSVENSRTMVILSGKKMSEVIKVILLRICRTLDRNRVVIR